MSNEKEAYNEFIKTIELVNIVLHELNVKRMSEPIGKQLQVDLNPTFDLEADHDKHFINASAKFNVNITEKVGKKNNKIFSIKANFLLCYKFSEEVELTEEMSDRFIQTTVPVNSWPYGRELISSLTTRMGFPALIIEPFIVI